MKFSVFVSVFVCMCECMHAFVHVPGPEAACRLHYVFGVKLTVKKCTGPLRVIYQLLTHTLLTCSFLRTI